MRECSIGKLCKRRRERSGARYKRGNGSLGKKGGNPWHCSSQPWHFCVYATYGVVPWKASTVTHSNTAGAQAEVLSWELNREHLVAWAKTACVDCVDFGICCQVSRAGGIRPITLLKGKPWSVFRRCHPETVARALGIRCTRGEGRQGGYLCPVLESNLWLTHLLPLGKSVKLDSDYSGSAPWS